MEFNDFDADIYYFTVSYQSPDINNGDWQNSYFIEYYIETGKVYEYNLYDDNPIVYDFETGK